MFKLESYITPILLNYVAKYVKNIRDEDAQVSLWEGEVTFQNLDMRLDVLEEELNLPVELVSGHIHELSILVPWTKLMSEPVSIVINTIEFVAKLPDEDRKERRAMNMRERRRRSKRLSELPEEQQAGGTGSGVVNKIINNITLQCNNIILKYVEDDIVVSMNVQCLSFNSADENWNAAMVDVNPLNVFIRKILEISDLTICLDRRNTAGRIEVCQEPVLYRCTLQCRVLRKYNTTTMNTSSTTRIGVFTKSLDFNVSSLQFPMVVRLIKMLLELKPADMEDDTISFDERNEPAVEEVPQEEAQRQGNMFSWAWNLLPSFEAPPPLPSTQEQFGHAFDIGIYAEELNFQLKNSEYVTDQTMGGIKRIRYTPILRISLGGIYYERSQLKETDWTNVKAGLSSVCMEPLGVYRSEDPKDRTLVNTAEFQNDRSFIDKSLFDENYKFSDNTWCTTNYDDYFARHTDEYMLFRSPVLAFDIVEYRVASTNKQSSSAIGQLKDFGLRAQYRLLSAGITFHFSQSFLQVKNVISDLLRPYDYPGYHAENVSDQEKAETDHSQQMLSNPLTYADMEKLKSYLPTCNYRFELRNMTVQFYPRLQMDDTTGVNQYRLSTTIKQSLLPYLQLKLPLAEGTLCGPVNAQRLVQMVLQVQDRPRELIDTCYNYFKFNVKNLTFLVQNTTPERGKAKLLNIPRMQVNFYKLLLPHLWTPNETALEIAEIQSEILNIEFSKRELILVTRLIPLILGYNSAELTALAKLVAQATISSDVIKLQTLASKLKLNYRKYNTHYSGLLSLRSINTDTHHTMMNMRNVVLSTTKGSQKKWLEMQLQIPIGEQTLPIAEQPATVIAFWIEPVRLTFDIYLLQFLNFREKSENSVEKELDPDLESLSQSERLPSISAQSIVTTLTQSQLPSGQFTSRRTSRNSRKVSVPEETVHLSSERDEKVYFEVKTVTPQKEVEADNFDSRKLLYRLCTMIILIEMAQVRIDVCEIMNRKLTQETTVEYTSIRLPQVKVKSRNSEAISRANLRTVIKLDANGPVSEEILAPVRTTITVALSRKLPEKQNIVEQRDFLEEENKPSDINIFNQVDSAPKKVDWLDDEHKRLDEQEEIERQMKGVYSFNVHIDMSAIGIICQRIKLLHEHYQILSNICQSMRLREVNETESRTVEPKLEIYTGSAQNYPSIKEFLDLDPNFEPPNREYVLEPDVIVNIFCQWTIPRITFVLESYADHKLRKIVLSIEDLLLNVDKHADFTKITTKVENVNLDYFEATLQSEWKQMDGLRIKMLGDSSNMPLLSVVVTTVNLQDLYTKIGARNPHNKKHTISELLIELQPIEIVVDLDQITEFLVPLCEVLEIMSSYNEKKIVARTPPPSIKTAQDLPMVHLTSKGIYVYVPLQTEKKCCSVLLLRIESINLTPNLENPLVRQPIRQDIYHKAAELNILGTPGSLVEDRQYELSIRKISLSSGNWTQTQKYRMEALDSPHTNPAFEWNNQKRRTELEHMDIFHDFDFISIYAPAITYENLLVCGQNVEYNCVTDFVATLCTHQINLISCILLRLQRLSSIVNRVCTRGEPRNIHTQLPVYDMSSRSWDSLSVNTALTAQNSTERISVRSENVNKIKRASQNPGVQTYLSYRNSRAHRPSFFDAKSSSDTFLGSCQSDSGIYVNKIVITPETLRSSASESLQQQRSWHRYPQTVSFVAGIFVLKVYDVIELPDIPQPILKPLILLTVSQPSFMTTQNLRESITQASIFNFNVHVACPGEPPPGTSDPHHKQFNEVIFDTLPGNTGSSGIPPPLLIIKSQLDRAQQLEVDVELRKPIVLRLCENSIKQLASDLIRIYSVLNESPCFSVRSELPVVRTTPMRQLKLQCYDADRLHLACDLVTIKFYDKMHSYTCTAVCMDFSARVKFSSRPQKAAVKSALGTFYLQAGEKILLHPLLMRLSADLRSEPWCPDQLLIGATLKLNLLHIDASILNILELRQAYAGLTRIREHVALEWQTFLQQRPMLGEPTNIVPGSVLLYTPTFDRIVHSKTSPEPKTEFYQDDLRAGAFQFVYLNTDAVLPMPYQVQIIKKNYGIICWRYPQPRQMSGIHIYPVPMPVNNPIHIKCRMEYFSETHETFLHYCDFELSETTSKEIQPPERHICANIWRVVIMQSLISVDGTCFETDEDEDLQSIDSSRIQQDFKGDADNDFILHPKVLVGCMRIDTTFNAQFVPKVQLLLSCKNIELNFLNQPDAYNELPPLLKKYNLKRTTTISQTFATLDVQDLHLYAVIHQYNDFSVETDFRSRVKCLDYGFINMIDIVEPISFQSYFRFNGGQRLLLANFLIDKLRLNCGPCVIHTLLSSKQHWQELLEQRSALHTLMPKCVVVNRMHARFSFGQTDTGERIFVEPHELQLYHFRSDYHSQELTFFIENPTTQQIESSDSVHIALKFDDEHTVKHLRVGKRCITIKVGKLSATQVYILVKGQIELMSMVPYELIAEFRREGKNYDEQNLLEHVLVAKGRASFYHTVVRNADINMRLKLSMGRGKGRTGDIPLKPNNSLPWLVKVPTQSPQQFISLWIRILREDIVLDNVGDDFYPQKILVSIWPIFEICNMLSCDLMATESSTEERFKIASEGGRMPLNTPTTHVTEHKVSFEIPAELGSASQSDYTFMLKAMDWQKFFHYDHDEWTIETTLQNLRKALKPKWPMNDQEELRVRRCTMQQNTFDIIYKAQATREFSCTLGLSVAAWGMFINATGLEVSIFQAKTRSRCSLKANCLEMMPMLTGLFSVDIPYGTSWIASNSVCLDELTDTVGNSRYTVLRANSFIDIVVVRNEDVLRFLLEYKIEDGCRVFKLRPKFVVTNFTNVVLHALPLTMDHKETSSREDVHALDMAKKNRNLISVEKSQQCIGMTMDVFYDLNARKAKHTSDTAFVYFVCFAVAGNWDISIPIPLAIPFARRCFSLQDGKESIPLVVTLIEKDNVYYLNVFRDTAPAIIISNHTNVKFIVAQTTASGNSNVTSTNAEFAGKHFEWNQLVSPRSKCYYTPPQMYSNFPDVEFTICNLSLAVYNEKGAGGKKKIGWSKPIRTDKSWKKFLHVPNHGDVKVVVCDKHRVIRVTIYYISEQMEFSVKDLRSRLNQSDAVRATMPEQLTEKSAHNSPTKPASPTPTKEQITCAHFDDSCEIKHRMKIRLFIKKFVFSLQTDGRERDYLKTEVCNVYTDDMMVAYNDDDDERVLRLQIPNLQVDNQLYSNGKFDFPVLLCSEQMYRRSTCLPPVYDLDAIYHQQTERGPIALFTFIFYQDELQLNAVCCNFHPFRVYIEDAYLNQLLETLVECEPSNCVHTPSVERDRIQLSEGQTLLPLEVVAQARYIAEPLRLNNFCVEPLSLLLSVHTSSRLYIALDHSPLSFSRYERQQILTVPLRFGQSLGLHYLSGAIFGAGWVVGSLEILGSPSGLARSFTTGLRDFVSMPVQGLFRGPWGFFVGITQGSASLLRNVTAGTVNSVTKLAGSVARNLDRLTLDAEHIELTEARRRARPQGFADGLTQGMTGLGISLLGAVGGLAHHTLEARSSVGVIAGLTKGIVGALTKPISGAAEMLALTGQGVLHTVGFNTMPQQVEPSVTRNVALHRGSYCIWRFLPEELSRDQILFFYEITLLVHDQLRPALLFLTSSVLAIMEAGNDDLTFVSPVSKVEVAADRDDPTKFFLNLKPDDVDDIEGQMSFTNERIMKFLNSSRMLEITADSLNDLLHVHDDHIEQRQTQCVFFIKQNVGEHLVHYLKVISRTTVHTFDIH
ncbi:vacuolar protein sorting-associated protein 13B isoform X2 [Scaptodrosophila lebanonensis]|uniref:Vacuolar protein sorting-associated protein 13B isoform X2 n=1 Tax=Drosophila lebanonensis TaxID=7225 RepID=A0A6J2T842_DROLE|nr:vacuolar protein sorting-associated protein 13B isoform X2 [Scaptodrosophila lebanonensis]